MTSLFSRVIFSLGVVLMVSAIISIYITTIAIQNNGNQTGQQQQGQVRPAEGGFAGTVTIPQGASNQGALEAYYHPVQISVQNGTSVTWDNQDIAAHTATARDGSFDTGLIQPQNSATLTVEGQGTKDYYCTIHPWMTGSITFQQGQQQQNQTGQQQQNQTGQQQQNQTGQQQQGQVRPAEGGFAGTVTIPQGASNQGALEAYYHPDHITITSGTSVTWDNQDIAAHTATARDGSFDTGLIQPQNSATLTVEGQGTKDYYCTIHPWMTGSITFQQGQQDIKIT